MPRSSWPSRSSETRATSCTLNLLGKSQTFHGRQRVGDVMARATNDVRSLNYMVSPGLMLITDSLMNTIIPILLIGQIHPRLLVVPLSFVAILVITLIDYSRRLSPVTLAMRDQFGVMNAGLAEAIAGIEVVKANVRERYEWDKFTHNARLYRHHFVRQGEIQARVSADAGLLHCLGGGILPCAHRSGAKARSPSVKSWPSSG